MNPINTVKALLEITDASEDALINFYIKSAQNFIVEYCKFDSWEKTPITLDTTLVEMAVFKYRQRGVENISGESKGGLNESYLTEYPQTILNALNPHCKVKFI